jgi:tRNA pseudouridine55 synthase
MIKPIWKPLGASTHQLAKQVGTDLNQKATHTGTLDPMAEGVVVVLTGEDRFKKGTFTDWKKTYEFEILLGIETDSLDLLGLQTQTTYKELNNLEISENIKELLPQFIGKQKQTQPQFSSQRVDGKSGFDLAKENRDFKAKENDIEISSLSLLESRELNINDVQNDINERINLVSGEFRQQEILSNWEETLNQLEEREVKTFSILKLSTTVSKRTYIRSLVRDISNKLNIPAVTYSITRVQEGPYSKKDCT